MQKIKHNFSALSPINFLIIGRSDNGKENPWNLGDSKEREAIQGNQKQYF